MQDEQNHQVSPKPTLSERFGDWAGNSPVVGIPVVAAVLGYQLLRLPDRMVRGYLSMKFTPLEKFEPSHEGWGAVPLTPPHWQDLVFGEGRAEKLLKRLEGIEQVLPRVQKICLFNSGGGLKVLPAHRELTKYGLNDNEIGHFMYDLDRTIGNMVIHKDTYNENGRNIAFDDNVSLLMNGKGIYSADANKTPIIEQDDPYLYMQMGMTGLIGAYRENGHADDKVIEISNQVSRAVYQWILEDVLPAVPHFFPASYGAGYNAAPQEDGSFRLDPLPEGYQLKDHAKGEMDFMEKISPRNTKSLYEILADGYKGTLPAHGAFSAPSEPRP